jgi:hypothetical protein
LFPLATLFRSSRSTLTILSGAHSQTDYPVIAECEKLRPVVWQVGATCQSPNLSSFFQPACNTIVGSEEYVLTKGLYGNSALGANTDRTPYRRKLYDNGIRPLD